MSSTNKTRHIKWHETFQCKSRLDTGFCYNKQLWNNGKCRCECKELVDEGICDKGYIWNSSNWECDCGKLCDAGEYLDYANCKYRKRLINQLVEECNGRIDEKKITLKWID